MEHVRAGGVAANAARYDDEITADAVRSLRGSEVRPKSMPPDRGLAKVYETLPSIDLSGGALERGAKRLAVIPLSGVEWSDLDEPGGHAFAVRESLAIHHRTAAVSQCGTADERPIARTTSCVSGAAAFPRPVADNGGLEGFPIDER